METKTVETKLVATTNYCLPPSIQDRINLRMMSSDTWIEKHASGTLRKNKKIGFAWQKQYLHERIAYEFGYLFESVPKTWVCYNDAITEEDCHSVTEAGWFIERYISMSIFPEDCFEAKYIKLENPNGMKKEGIGIIVKQTSFVIPPGNIIFAIIAEFNPMINDYLEARNPF